MGEPFVIGCWFKSAAVVEWPRNQLIAPSIYKCEYVVIGIGRERFAAITLIFITEERSGVEFDHQIPLATAASTVHAMVRQLVYPR